MEYLDKPCYIARYTEVHCCAFGSIMPIINMRIKNRMIGVQKNVNQCNLSRPNYIREVSKCSFKPIIAVAL